MPMTRIATLVCAGLMTTTMGTAHAADGGRCEDGQRADNYPFWEFIANNAKRTADDYAVNNNPMAFFGLADVAPVYQVAGEHAGVYLVKLVNNDPGATSFAMLRPNFPFCGDPSSLDDNRSDLFTVVVAKFNGAPF